MNKRVVHFKVDPTFHIKMARDMMLSEDWRGALNLLAKSLIQPDLNTAVAALKGEVCLVAADESGSVLTPAPQDQSEPSFKRYLKTVEYQNCGILQVGGEFYRPYGVLPGFGQDDFDYAKEYFKRFADDFGESPKWYREYRARFYMRHKESDLVFFDIHDTPVFFKRVQGPAFWLPTFTDPAAALEDFLKHDGLESIEVYSLRRGDAYDPKSWAFYEEAIQESSVYVTRHCRDELLDDETMDLLRVLSELADDIGAASDVREAPAPIDPARPPLFLAAVKLSPREIAINRFLETTMQRRIVDAAAKNGGFLTLMVKIHDEPDYPLRVPKLPFLYWAAQRANRFAFQVSDLPEWEPICPSGMKMQGDDRMHTDWWIGAGLGMHGAYDKDNPVNKAAWAFAYAIARGKGEDCLWLAGKGRVFGIVVQPKPNEAVPPGSIAVVPSAGVDYELAMMSACKDGKGAVIAEVGSQAAHLAKVGREGNFRVVVVPDAMSRFKPGDLVALNLNDRTVKHTSAEAGISPTDEDDSD